MKASEIKVGGIYLARIGDPVVRVRVESINVIPSTLYRKSKTTYTCTNLKTDRKVTIKSAAKFRGEAKTLPKTPERLRQEQVVREVLAPEYPMPLTAPTAAKVKAKRKAPTPYDDLSERYEDGDPAAVELVRAEEKAEREVARKETANETMARVLLPKPRPRLTGGGAMTAPQAESEKGKSVRENVTPLLTEEDRALIEERRKRFGMDDQSYAEIREFEAKTGRPWWKFAEKGETWGSFKRRGCPTEKKAPPIVQNSAQNALELTSGGKSPPRPRADAGADPKRSQNPPAKPSAPPKAKKEPGAMSNKEIVYREWLKTTQPLDIAKTAALVPEVQQNTVKAWTKMWEKGQGLPAIAKELPPSQRGKVK